jgi:hypothetical protein
MHIPNYDNLGKKKDKNEKEHEYKVLHPLYEKLSRTVICGQSGSGKTNLLMHIILTPMIYYEKLVIYTKTPNQPKFIELQKIMDDIAKKEKVPIFCEIVDKPVPDPDTYEDKIYKLIVFDDMILSKKDFDNIVKHYVLGRHKKCSCIFLSQSYYETKKNLRINCTHFHLFNVGGRRETRSICIDHANMTEDIYNKNTKGYDFITINKLNKEITKNIDVEIEK